MRKSIIFISCLMLGLVVAVGSASATEIAWDKIIGVKLDKLTADNKAEIKTYLNKFNNTRGCEGTLAKCLAEGDMSARRHSGYVARMVRKGKDEAFIAKGIKDRHESAFPEETFEVNLKDHPFQGDPNKAKVIVAEYACFQCPFCAHVAPKLKGIDKKYKGKVAHYFKMFPVRTHPRGVAAALASYAAMKQGKFWPMADMMFENRADLEDDDLLSYAKKVGLDVNKYNADIKSSPAMRFIEKDKLEGMRFGVESTPSFFVNGKLYLGSADFKEILDRVEEELDIVEGRIK